MSSGPAWLCLSFGNFPFFGHITQVKKSWGQAYQQSFRATLWRSSSMQYGNRGTTTIVSCSNAVDKYIPLYTVTVMVYTSIYHVLLGIYYYIKCIYYYIACITWYIQVYTIMHVVYAGIKYRELNDKPLD